MKAREWMEYCSGKEWGNDVMWQIAQERFAKDETIDICRVYEHGGWHLSFNRDGVIVSTANDMAKLEKAAYEWFRQFDGVDLVGYSRRKEDGNHVELRHASYFPRIAAVA